MQESPARDVLRESSRPGQAPGSWPGSWLPSTEPRRPRRSLHVIHDLVAQRPGHAVPAQNQLQAGRGAALRCGRRCWQLALVPSCRHQHHVVSQHLSQSTTHGTPTSRRSRRSLYSWVALDEWMMYEKMRPFHTANSEASSSMAHTQNTASGVVVGGKGPQAVAAAGRGHQAGRGAGQAGAGRNGWQLPVAVPFVRAAACRRAASRTLSPLHPAARPALTQANSRRDHAEVAPQPLVHHA